MNKLVDLANKAIEAFRIGHEAEGSERLTSLIDQIMIALQNKEFEVDPLKLNAIFEKIINAQTRSDYVYLADMIQFRLIELFIASSPKN